MTTTFAPPDWPTIIRTRLSWGADHPVTIGQLAESMKVSRRVVERAVEQLRLEGQPLCTGSAGLWLSRDPAELRQHYQALRRRYIRQAVGARALLRTAIRFEKAQMTLWGGA